MVRVVGTLVVIVMLIQHAHAVTYFVDISRPNDIGSGTNWVTAKKTIQAAVNIASNNDTVCVADGVYGAIYTANKAITILSINGATETVIDGRGSDTCANLSDGQGGTNTVLIGFTLRNGNADTRYYYGGGAFCGTLEDCKIMGNWAGQSGGGAANSVMRNCVITGNSADSSGGGASGCTLTQCTLSENVAGTWGGGAYGCVLNKCILSANTVMSGDGGGAYDSDLSECILSGNSASSYGGGAMHGTLSNCEIVNNMAFWLGGGAARSVLTNCSVVNNWALEAGGGTEGGTFKNCIIWGNRKLFGATDNFYGGNFSYCCASPCPAGTGNFDLPPGFVDADDGNIRLRAGSPCINSGSNAYTNSMIDIFGGSRVLGGVVDMGACEGGTTGHIVTVRVLGFGSITPNTAQGVQDGGTLVFSAQPGPRPFIGYLTNGTYATSTPEFAWDNVIADGTVTAIFQTTNWYVNVSQPDNSGDGLSWATAKRTVQAAADAALAGDVIWVTNGVYSLVSTGNKGISIRSVNGADVTVIDGGLTNRCATLGCAASQTNTVMTGFSLRNGVTMYDCGGATRGGTFNGCLLTGNQTKYRYGGGSFNGRLISCVLSNNMAEVEGGAAFQCVMTDCRLLNNVSSQNGGGAANSVLDRCRLSGNSANSWGGGAIDAALDGCILDRNIAGNDGGAADSSYLNNSTLFGNNTRAGGGGTRGCSLTNSIAWHNLSLEESENNIYEPRGVGYSCSFPTPSGLGNTNVDPHFVDEFGGDFRLRTGSACIDRGTNVCVIGSVDIAGSPRIQNSVVDMGAVEGAVAGHVILVRVQGSGSVIPGISQVLPSGGNVTFVSQQCDRPFLYYLTNGVFASAETNFTWTGVSADGTLTAVFQSTTWYVDCTRPDNSGNGLTWNTAKRTIQAAINLAIDGDSIVVADGVYTPIASNNKSITVRSENGADSTWINGGQTNRCATLGYFRCCTNTVLDGFTLMNGKGVWINSVDDGGGACGGTIRNCFLTNNTAFDGGGVAYGVVAACRFVGNAASYNGGAVFASELSGCILTTNTARSGGGAYGGSLTDCMVAGNVCSSWGGGSSASVLNNCMILSNSASTGGGSHYGTLNNCMLAFNRSDSDGGGGYMSILSNCVLALNSSVSGGGVNRGTLDNCMLSRNSASRQGGGAYSATLNNCTILNNTAITNGGGSCYGTLNNCTLSGTTAGSSGGGAYYGTLKNCIVWGNTKTDGNTYNHTNCTFYYSCTTPLPSGTGNTNSDPRFVSSLGGNLRLRSGSPCIDRGNNGYVVGSVDLLGKPRVHNGTVDMGACEGGFSATEESPVPVPFAWLDLYPTLLAGAGSNMEEAARDDSDHDGLASWQEYVAGTDPTNAASVFVATVLESDGQTIVHWAPDLVGADPGRVYSVYGTPLLRSGFSEIPLTNVLAGTPLPVQAFTTNRFFKVGVWIP